MRHLLSVADLAAEELAQLLDRASQLKREPEMGRLSRAHTAALLFEHASLRTRIAYEVALMHLGGLAIPLEMELGRREALADVARTISHLVSIVVARVGDHRLLEALAERAEIPVVNALSDREHPVEVLADTLTLYEQWGDLRGHRLAYVGDGNNICHSLLLLAPLARMDITIASPTRYAPATSVVEKARALARQLGTRVDIRTDPREAVAGADAVYTDVWVSMGQQASDEARKQVFAAYQVNRELMSQAKPDAVVLHCLPARRGEEITAEVLEGPQSLAFRRLANLVPTTMAVLSWLLEP
jgi:ornithine carbamoyltransferase